MNPSNLHLISTLSWLLAVVAYIYLQNNLYSILSILLMLLLFAHLGFQILWKNLLKTWLLLSATFIVFYGLFLHRGNHVLFSIPGNVPLLSGIISLSSIFYGFFLGGSFTLALYVFSLTAEISKNRRLKFYLPGVWQNISILFSFLSHFTALLFQHRKTFDKKLINRGLKLGTLKRFRLFLHDAFFYSLENSFEYAEVLELRGFGRLYDRPAGDWNNHSILILGIFLVTLVFYRIEHNTLLLACLIMLSLLFVFSLRKLRETSGVARTYTYSLSFRDWIVIAASVGFIILNFVIANGQEGYLSSGQTGSYFHMNWKISVAFIVHVFIFYMCLGFERNNHD